MSLSLFSSSQSNSSSSLLSFMFLCHGECYSKSTTSDPFTWIACHILQTSLPVIFYRLTVELKLNIFYSRSHSRRHRKLYISFITASKSVWTYYVRPPMFYYILPVVLLLTLFNYWCSRHDYCTGPLCVEKTNLWFVMINWKKSEYTLMLLYLKHTTSSHQMFNSLNS